jgi:hypothetical protein
MGLVCDCSIETSALDGSNVETAFENILTGSSSFSLLSGLLTSIFWSSLTLDAQQTSTASCRRSNSRPTPSRAGQATEPRSRSPRLPTMADRTPAESAVNYWRQNGRLEGVGSCWFARGRREGMAGAG